MTYAQGIERNRGQFGLQLLTVFAVGLTVGAERNVVPILGRDVLGIESIHPIRLATGLGVYRVWRDADYGFGAVVVGVTADLGSIRADPYGVVVVTFVSGGIVPAWTRETHPTRGDYAPPVGSGPERPDDD